ncbi:MAG: DUF2332 domain-containing protein [Alphaproteobacteria bacterium]|nr:DUF2332 domain-containing protein [Alphaproteobacteria bacterium]MBL6936921.1 DUF2332 domain-containing protein [Alphaproteobacteria bacterium]MBL7097690.1 DUF2332 domain-containing protein [Alphaproteobacteria bacterium]
MSGGHTDYWDFFAQDALKTGGVLYSKLAAGIGADEELKALAGRARPGQPHANLILAAVHFLLLRGADDPLKRFYATVGGPVSADAEDPMPDFRAFVQKHRAQIQPLIEARVTNTNEVGRSAILHPGFATAAKAAGAPLSLIEIGPSAGLNLIWDKYGVRYRKDGAVVAAINETAPLVIEAEARGDKVPPVSALPAIAARVGLELNPVDLSNADDRDWLRALIWPDQVSRLERLDKAIALFAKEKPPILAGDALALLPDVLAQVPRHATPVVYHTIAVYQFSREMREALESILTIAGLRRPVLRLSFEYDGQLYLLSVIRYADGVREETRLASCHPHGTWIEWLD